jgi:hypothetical protein
MGGGAVIDSRRVAELNVSFSRAISTVERETAALVDAERKLSSIREAQRIVQAVAAEVQREAHDRIASVVTRCLEAVFSDPYEFRIRFDKKRGKTEAVLELSRDGENFDDPLNEVGGGVIDVASLALRLACVAISKPPRRRVLLLDEPWSNVRGEGNRLRTRRVLATLADEFGVQFVLNTDIPDYRMGQVVEMTDALS